MGVKDKNVTLALEDPLKKKEDEYALFPTNYSIFKIHLQRDVVLYAHMDIACQYTCGVCQVTMAIKKQLTVFLKREESSLQSFLSLSNTIMKNGAWIMSYWWLISNLEVD